MSKDLKMIKDVISAFLVLFLAKAITGHCFTANDIIVNETSIDTAVRDLIDGSTEFSLHLLRILHSQQGSHKNSIGLFLSPYSIWSALVVIYMGAKGTTEQNMKNVLGIGDLNKAIVWEAFKNIQTWDMLQDETGWTEKPALEPLWSANRIYFQKDIVFKDCMLEVLDSEIGFVDFANRPLESRDEINKWVEKETQQKIKDLIPADGITGQTRMVVANAVYFKESWQLSFDQRRTRKQRFTTPYRKIFFVDMMKTTGRFLYGKSEELNCHALELPYAGNVLSMTILLPNNRFTGVGALASKLTPDLLRNLLLDLYPREVDVSLPKFKVEDSFELSTVLNHLGLRNLFDIRRVDLSGFTGKRDFFVDAVHHKAFIDVNEEGTEAVNATAIISSGSARTRRPASFIADYPFVYFIQSTISNVILFLGTVERPGL